MSNLTDETVIPKPAAETTTNRQSQESLNRNIDFFSHNETYKSSVETMETYRQIRRVIERELADAKELLDIGNGGVFAYDINLSSKLTAVDLFLSESTHKSPAPHVKFVQGSALDLPFPEGQFDTVLLALLIHHLTGKNAAESFQNMQLSIREAHRVLKPGGRLVIVESCIPWWFYRFEKLVFRTAQAVTKPFLTHPMTIQYPIDVLKESVQTVFHSVEKVEEIPLGKHVIQFGFKVPSSMTPVRPYVICAKKGK